MSKGRTPLEKYMFAWECFCKHSFLKPDIFHAVFIMDLGDQPEKLIRNYYEIYPADLINIPEELKPILIERSMSKRGKSILQFAAKEGQIDEFRVDDINEITILIWQGMLTNILNNRLDYKLEEAELITMQYIRQIVDNAKTTEISVYIIKIRKSLDDYWDFLVFLFHIPKFLCPQGCLHSTLVS